MPDAVKVDLNTRTHRKIKDSRNDKCALTRMVHNNSTVLIQGSEFTDCWFLLLWMDSLLMTMKRIS